VEGHGGLILHRWLCGSFHRCGAARWGAIACRHHDWRQRQRRPRLRSQPIAVTHRGGRLAVDTGHKHHRQPCQHRFYPTHRAPQNAEPQCSLSGVGARDAVVHVGWDVNPVACPSSPQAALADD